MVSRLSWEDQKKYTGSHFLEVENGSSVRDAEVITAVIIRRCIGPEAEWKWMKERETWKFPEGTNIPLIDIAAMTAEIFLFRVRKMKIKFNKVK